MIDASSMIRVTLFDCSRTSFSGRTFYLRISDKLEETPKAFNNPSPGLRAPARYPGWQAKRSFATLKGLLVV